MSPLLLELNWIRNFKFNTFQAQRRKSIFFMEINTWIFGSEITWTVGKLLLFLEVDGVGLLTAAVGDGDEFPDRVDMMSGELLKAN